MQFIKKITIALTLLLSLITFAQSETTWITKKKDKSKKVEKVVKKETTTSWIKKKKENKEKFKEKKIESQSWITKKTKKEKKQEKKILKKYLKIADLPKANFYFSAKSENGQIIYGYVNSDKKSKLFNLNQVDYYSLSTGFAYLNDGKTTCVVNSKLGSFFDKLSGEVVVNCINKLEFTGYFVQQSEGVGIGSGETNKGDVINFKFSQNKEKNYVFYNDYNKNIGIGPEPESIYNVKLNGKYYALLIGNSNYVNWATLSSPKNDVKEIEKILNTHYDFEKVITVINGTEKQIMKAFKKLSNLTSDKDYVLIYYSGHGDSTGMGNYWIPIDGSKEKGLGDWINTTEIQDYILQEIPNHHIVLMSDSCYFSMTTKGNQDVDSRKSQSYQKLINRRAILVIQSGSNEPVEDSFDNKHSVFGKSFIASLSNNKNILRMRDVITEIELSHSGMQQQPQWGRASGWGDGGGDFLFIAKK